MIEAMPPRWREIIGEVAARVWENDIGPSIARDREAVFPPEGQVFEALRRTPPDEVRAVILGQDPYIGPGQAHGLAFSVPKGCPRPPSLRNILHVWAADVGQPEPQGGCLARWADNGVLLLNTVLTVDAGSSNSHRDRRWEFITKPVVHEVSRRRRPIAFLLWGRQAQSWSVEVENPDEHVMIVSSHPSPRSADRTGHPFNRSRPFSTANRELCARGAGLIDWGLERSRVFGGRCQEHDWRPTPSGDLGEGLPK